ncbi:hypothetical protein Cgig2_023821 [Carnegiea gigantea]|uniref:Methionine gamma-lyase n=1 Tax=Carnegiea gigantea TaxID=171969 RepID=A0A9Q1GPE8_9CARY|nr:hypothetical protein Cgig2_023821 [Carnegiea gigantea]
MSNSVVRKSECVDELVDPSNFSDAPAERVAYVCHELGQHKGVNISIEASNTFAFQYPEEMTLAVEGELGPDADVYVYSRSFNPTVEVLGRYLAAMEATESAYCTSSGMSAITAIFMYLCKNGGHVVAANALYGGTHFLLKNFLPEKCNVETKFVDITNFEEVDSAIIEGQTTVLYFETVSNPALVVADTLQLSTIAHKKNVKVVVDNTFAPMILTPAKYGADIVVHSLTKYVSGGSDVLAGAICGKHDMVQEITNFARGPLMMLGPVMNPMEAFQLLGRMAHLGVRMKKHCSRALKLATRMKNELNIKVMYPGLKDHPDYELMNQMRNKGYGFGGVVCIDVDSTDQAYKLLTKLRENKFGFLAVDLGYYETLMSCPGATAGPPKPSPKRGDITPGFIRFSVGYLGTLDQKWKQFKKAYQEMDA